MASPSKTWTIKDLSRRSGVSTHTLRFWEKALDGVILPARTNGGQRRYSVDDLFIIEEIKQLKDKGYCLAEIRGRLNQRRSSEAIPHNHIKNPDVLADRIAEIVRSVVYHYLEGRMEKE